MGKLMKYEIKGSYRYILGVLALVVILTGGIYFYMNNAIANDGTTLQALFIGLSFMVIFGTMFATFFYIVNLFRKELYEDRGYLTFTLPLTGKEILGSKLLVAIFWFAVLGLGILISNLIGLRMVIPSEFWKDIPFGEILGEIGLGPIISLVLFSILGGVVSLITIYFSMALGRITMKNRKLSGIWFIIFLVVSFIINIGLMQFKDLVPYYLNVSRPGIESYDSIMDNDPPEISMGNDVSVTVTRDLDMRPLLLYNGSGDSLINIGGLVYNIFIAWGGFILTGYLIEKKIDL